MVQYYTLEQAAQLLRITPEKLREMVRQGKIRAFQDRGTLRFRAQEIDELARAQGLGSDHDLPLGEVSGTSSSGRRKSQMPAPGKEEGSDDFDFNLSLDDDSAGKNKPPGSGARRNPPTPTSRPSRLSPAAKASDSDVRLVPDGSDINFELTVDDGAPPAKSPVPRPRQSRLAAGTQKSDSDIRMDRPKTTSDSDVRIEPDTDTDEEAVSLGQSRAKTPSDSDIRLEIDDLPVELDNPNRPGSDPMVTEEVDLDLEALEQATPKSKPPSSKRSKAPSAKLGSKPVNLPTSSPFELSEEDIDVPAPPPVPSAGPQSGKKSSKKSLEESSSDFELSLEDPDTSSVETPALNKDSDEVNLGELAGTTGTSGISLDDPGDSGISLEADGSDEMEFELSLDDGASSKDQPVREEEDSSSEFELSLDDGEASGSDSAAQSDSDSEFELTLDDSGSSELALDESDSSSDSEFELTLDEEGGLSPVEDSGDLAAEDGGLFEETNFDVPSLDDESGSEAVALDDSSDFDLALDDSVEIGEGSGSQVVPLGGEDDESDVAAETVARPRKSKLGDEEEEEPDFSALDESGEAVADDETDQPLPEEEEEEVRAGPRQSVAAPPAEWGVMPAIVMLPCVIVLFVVGLMGYELIQGMYGYHKGTRITGLVIDPLARMFPGGEDLPKD